METINQYDRQANDFLTATKTEFKLEFLKHDFHFEGDKEKRDIYKITLKRGSRSYKFNFGQSIANSGFYARYGRTEYNIPRDKVNLSDSVLKRWAKQNIQYDFGNAKSDIIVRPTAPTPYDVLACLTKYDPETFHDFCNEYGYERDSISAKKTYKAVKKEWLNVAMMYNEPELDMLREIQ